MAIDFESDHVKGDEALAAARRPPHHAQAVAGNEPLDEVTAICAKLDLAEGRARYGRLALGSGSPSLAERSRSRPSSQWSSVGWMCSAMMSRCHGAVAFGSRRPSVRPSPHSISQTSVGKLLN
jgi:hypothetical protein